MLNQQEIFKEILQPQDSGHNIHTPYSLTRKIIKLMLGGKKIKDIKKWGIPYTVEFALDLLDFGFNPNQLVIFGDSYEKEQVANSLTIQYIDVSIIDKIYKLDDEQLDKFIKDNGLMLFDRIVTNSPYTAKDKNNKVYQHHYNNFSKLLKSDGMIADVTPIAMVKGFCNRKVMDVHLKNQNLAYLNIDNVRDKYFPDVGIEHLCWFIVDNTFKGNPIVDTGSKKTPVDFKVLPTFPVNQEQYVYEILQKLFQGTGSSQYDRSSKFILQNIDEDKSSKHKLINKIKDGQVTDFTNVKVDIKNYPNIPRMFYNTMGKGKFFIDYNYDHFFKKDATFICVTANTFKELENLAEFVENSKLVDFYSNCVNGNNRSPFDTFIANFKKLDFSRKWNDEQVLKHFKVSQLSIDKFNAKFN